MEQWVVIDEFPKYSVSNTGQVRMDRTKHILRQSSAGRGHLQVGLYRQGDAVQYKRSVDRLVASAFVPNTSDRYDTLIHLDGDRKNCRADNLCWRPRWFAIKYAMQFRTMRDYQMPPIRDIETGEIYTDVWEIIVRDGLLWNDIKQSISEHTYAWPSHKRYAWVD